jgi:ankyrin repeat protein
MNKLLIFSLAFAIALACSKKKNEVEEAQRLPEDMLNPAAMLKSDDPATVKAGLETWLQYYPDEINRVLPSESTSVLGLVAAKYFESENKSTWLDLMNELLNRGADPNIFFLHQGIRRGILHAAAIQGDADLVGELISRLGTMDPPLRLNCDRPREQPGRDQGLRLNLNLQEEKTGRTPLHYAVEGRNPNKDFIEYLLLQGANPDLQDESLQLVSPYQLVSSNPALLEVFQRYSGPQIRYDARLNSFINDEIEKAPEQRQTILDLAKAYQDMVNKEGFQNVQDINRVITLCKTGEKANLMGYALQYLFPAVSTKAAQAVKARNDSIQVWMKDYGAKICLADALSIRNSDESMQSISLKDFFKSSLSQHSASATAPVKTLNRNLWCSIVKPKAMEGGCWDPATDEQLNPGTVCSP